jgi:hypothetical protein
MVASAGTDRERLSIEGIIWDMTIIRQFYDIYLGDMRLAWLVPRRWGRSLEDNR